jgi:hypothetical protein
MQEYRTFNSASNIRQIFGRLRANSLAKQIGATQRKSRKFTAVDIIISYWQLITVGEFSYDKWSIQLSLLVNGTISGQAVWKRIGPKMVELLKLLLKKSFKRDYSTIVDLAVFKFFANVYIQDATHFNLPRQMASVFPGSYSRFGNSSTAKIQAVFNLKNGAFSDFWLTSFRDNDQKDSNRVAQTLCPGDLIIRDLGYFVLKVFSNISNRGAFFLSRFKYGVSIYDTNTLGLIDLQRLLKKSSGGVVDTCVKIGSKEQLDCRLVAVAVSEDTANARRRKAKQDRNRKANHSKKYLDLLGYTLYITNIPKDIWSVKQVEKAYRSRWYIEILFKGWKSNLNMKVTIPERYLNQNRVEFFFYACLLMVNLLVIPLFLKAQKWKSKAKQNISILKLCAFISHNIFTLTTERDWLNSTSLIQYACAYEKRKSRVNSIQLMMNSGP